MRRLGLKIGDVLLIACLAVLALAVWMVPLMRGGRASEVEVVRAGTGEVQRYSLARDARYEIVSVPYSLTVEIVSGEVFVACADCPDQICVHSPAISRVGQSIVCAPAGIAVRIIGEGAGLDGISG